MAVAATVAAEPAARIREDGAARERLNRAPDEVKVLKRQLMDAIEPLEMRRRETFEREKVQKREQHELRVRAQSALFANLTELLDRAETLCFDVLVEKWEALVQAFVEHVVEPGEVRFGDVELGTKKTVDLRISYAGRTDWKISDIRGNSDNVEVRLDPVQRKGTLTNYLLHITLKENAPSGELQDELVVVTNDEKNEQFTLPLNARVIPPISISPVFVSLGDVGKGKSVQNRLMVRSKKPFAITSVDCPDARFQFTLPEGTKTLHVLPFTFKGELLEGQDNGSLKEKITVKTSLGDDMTPEVTVAGRVIN